MHYSALAVAAFSAAAAAASETAPTRTGLAAVLNFCYFDVHVWSVSDNGTTSLGKIAQNENVAVEFGDSVGELVASRDEDAMEKAKGQISLKWGPGEDDTVLYNLGSAFGSFVDAVTAKPDNEECDTVEWPQGQPVAEESMGGCTIDSNVALGLCA